MHTVLNHPIGFFAFTQMQEDIALLTLAQLYERVDMPGWCDLCWGRSLVVGYNGAIWFATCPLSAQNGHGRPIAHEAIGWKGASAKWANSIQKEI